MDTQQAGGPLGGPSLPRVHSRGLKRDPSLPALTEIPEGPPDEGARGEKTQPDAGGKVGGVRETQGGPAILPSVSSLSQALAGARGVEREGSTGGGSTGGMMGRVGSSKGLEDGSSDGGVSEGLTVDLETTLGMDLCSGLCSSYTLFFIIHCVFSSYTWFFSIHCVCSSYIVFFIIHCHSSYIVFFHHTLFDYTSYPCMLVALAITTTTTTITTPPPPHPQAH